ncbi:Cilia- and flagella-associated protein 20 [Blattella germanica]|nr:Cilia- and flagella-associated protein 20 [Blattella germanica]
MFRQTVKSRFMTIFNSVSNKPLHLWKRSVMRDGYIQRLIDKDTLTLVVDLIAPRYTDSSITCPKDPDVSLGVTLPILVFLVKNLKHYFRIEIQVKHFFNFQ